MIRVATSGTIDAPIGKVWDFMVDLSTMPQRDPSVISVSWQPPLQVGSVAIITFRQMGKRTGRYEVKELEPNHMLKVQLTAMGDRIEGTGTWLFEPVAEGKTMLSSSVQIEVRGLMRLISPFLSISASEGARKGFDRIRTAVEAGGNDNIGSDPGLNARRGHDASILHLRTTVAVAGISNNGFGRGVPGSKRLTSGSRTVKRG